MNQFQDKVVWITGASAGLGKEMALQFARAGAKVALSARRQERLDELAGAITGEGGTAAAFICDVTSQEAVKATVEAVVSHFGRLDIVVANAGFGVVGPVEELDAEDWRRQFDLNVTALAITAKYAIPHLKETAGRLVLIGSVASMVTRVNAGPYSSSKAAVRSIGQTLAMELHGTGVSCTTIHPGFVASDIARTDNNGVYRAEREDPRPAKLMWPTDKAAEVMLKAIAKRKREYVFTGHGKIFGYLGRHCPGFVHFIGTRVWMPKR